MSDAKQIEEWMENETKNTYLLLDDEDESRRSHRRHIMVDVLGNNPWDSKFISTVQPTDPVPVPVPAPVSIPTLTDAHTDPYAIIQKPTLTTLDLITTTTNPEEDVLEPIPEVKTWEIRQLDALRKFAGTSTAPSTSSENDHQYQQMRMPRNKQMRMPTPVFRPLSGRLFKKYPPYVYQLSYVRGFQTLWRRHRYGQGVIYNQQIMTDDSYDTAIYKRKSFTHPNSYLEILRAEKKERERLYDTACILQEWAKQRLIIKGYFNSAEYWALIRNRILQIIVPDLALDAIVPVMAAAKRQITMIAQAKSAISTVIIW